MVSRLPAYLAHSLGKSMRDVKVDRCKDCTLTWRKEPGKHGL